MSKIEFCFEGKNIIIQCNKNDKMKQMIQQFLTKTNINPNSVIFLYSGNIINNPELTFDQIANIDDKNRNKMNILVHNSNIGSSSDQFQFTLCFGADESMKDYAKMVILLAFQEYPDGYPDKCSLIKKKFEKQYGGYWSCSFIKEGATALNYLDYFLGIHFRGYKITIAKTRNK